MAQTLTPDLLLQVKQMIAAAAVSLNGDFDKRIEELSVLKAEIDSKLGMVKTLEDAQQQASQIVAKAQADADKINKDSEDRAAVVDAAEDKLVARQDELKDQQAEFSRTRADFNTMADLTRATLEAESTHSENLVKELEERAARLDSQLAEVNELRRTLKAKLESIQAIAA